MSEVETITKKDLENVTPVSLRPVNECISDSEFKKLLAQIEKPLEFQKNIAVKIRYFLDLRIKQEMEEIGILSDHTRRWVESYSNLLDRIQKAMYGEKSVNLHIHKVTPSQIAARMRQV